MSKRKAFLGSNYKNQNGRENTFLPASENSSNKTKKDTNKNIKPATTLTERNGCVERKLFVLSKRLYRMICNSERRIFNYVKLNAELLINFWCMQRMVNVQVVEMFPTISSHFHSYARASSILYPQSAFRRTEASSALEFGTKAVYVRRVCSHPTHPNIFRNLNRPSKSCLLNIQSSTTVLNRLINVNDDVVCNEIVFITKI